MKHRDKINELNKSTYNRAAATAAGEHDYKLAMDFLNHSNRMGVEDEKDSAMNHQREENYMFFSNMDQMMRQLMMLSQIEPELLDQMLQQGHDWADDHMTVAKENLDQVFDFVMNKLQSGDMVNPVILGENRAPSFDEFTKIDEKKKGGLWDNVHKRRKKGKRPLRPGEKGYPSKEAWEENTKNKK